MDSHEPMINPDPETMGDGIWVIHKRGDTWRAVHETYLAADTRRALRGEINRWTTPRPGTLPAGDYLPGQREADHDV